MTERMAIVAVWMSVAACGDVGTDALHDGLTGSREDAESWSGWLGGPESMLQMAGIFDGLAKALADLPRDGTASAQPWAGSDWPVHSDSINVAWAGAGSRSAVAKYQDAFGGSALEDAVSLEAGVRGHGARSCFFDLQCPQGEICGKRRGKFQGACVGFWWGLCDGWATVSILYPEPQRPVRVGSTVFLVNDIKALLSYLGRDRTGGSHRAGTGERNDDRRAPRLDAWGRPESETFRALNPGTFHVLLANLLGKHQRSFVIDRDPGAAVYNHPLASYSVRTLRQVSSQEAAAIAGAGAAEAYPHGPAGAATWYVETDVAYVANSPLWVDGPLAAQAEDYTLVDRHAYILEVDGQGNITGGEWVGQSVLNHPDFAWVPLRIDTSTPRFLNPQRILELARLSVAESSAPAPHPG